MYKVEVGVDCSKILTMGIVNNSKVKNVISVNNIVYKKHTTTQKITYLPKAILE